MELAYAPLSRVTSTGTEAVLRSFDDTSPVRVADRCGSLKHTPGIGNTPRGAGASPGTAAGENYPQPRFAARPGQHAEAATPDHSTG
jgi:hypothetical protein